ncbi:hypothetical protein [Methylobacterium sp. yr596]|uniref:hypothetical protein n=1 Tax=Methylobacterium sp. yr596 TaxID=1761800 RepID=UPI0011145E08|nr:hypothetical protein [Methylobacterium sp. yr596]
MTRAVCDNCEGQGYTDMGRSACAICLGAGFETPELHAASAERHRLRETLAYIRDCPTAHDSGKLFTRDELVSMLAEMVLEAAEALKPAPVSSPIVKTGEGE